MVTCNITNVIDIEGTLAEDLTQGERVCRHQINEIVEFLREFTHGYGECYLLSSASLLVVREPRYFQGQYQLAQEDILAKRSFEDWAIRQAKFSFDVRSLTGAGLEATGVQHQFPWDNH